MRTSLQFCIFYIHLAIILFNVSLIFTFSVALDSVFPKFSDSKNSTRHSKYDVQKFLNRKIRAELNNKLELKWNPIQIDQSQKKILVSFSCIAKKNTRKEFKTFLYCPLLSNGDSSKVACFIDCDSYCPSSKDFSKNCPSYSGKRREWELLKRITCKRDSPTDFETGKFVKSINYRLWINVDEVKFFQNKKIKCTYGNLEEVMQISDINLQSLISSTRHQTLKTSKSSQSSKKTSTLKNTKTFTRKSSSTKIPKNLKTTSKTSNDKKIILGNLTIGKTEFILIIVIVILIILIAVLITIIIRLKRCCEKPELYNAQNVPIDATQLFPLMGNNNNNNNGDLIKHSPMLIGGGKGRPGTRGSNSSDPFLQQNLLPTSNMHNSQVNNPIYSNFAPFQNFSQRSFGNIASMIVTDPYAPQNREGSNRETPIYQTLTNHPNNHVNIHPHAVNHNQHSFMPQYRSHMQLAGHSIANNNNNININNNSGNRSEIDANLMPMLNVHTGNLGELNAGHDAASLSGGVAASLHSAPLTNEHGKNIQYIMDPNQYNYHHFSPHSEDVQKPMAAKKDSKLTPLDERSHSMYHKSDNQTTNDTSQLQEEPVVQTLPRQQKSSVNEAAFYRNLLAGNQQAATSASQFELLAGDASVYGGDGGGAGGTGLPADVSRGMLMQIKRQRQQYLQQTPNKQLSLLTQRRPGSIACVRTGSNKVAGGSGETTRKKPSKLTSMGGDAGSTSGGSVAGSATGSAAGSARVGGGGGGSTSGSTDNNSPQMLARLNSFSNDQINHLAFIKQRNANAKANSFEQKSDSGLQ